VLPPACSSWIFGSGGFIHEALWSASVMARP
jgi:hypothetical protein